MGIRRFLVKLDEVDGVNAIVKRDQLFPLQSMQLWLSEATGMAR